MLVGDVRTGPLAPSHLERKRREVGALDVVVQVGRRKGEVAVGGLHGSGVSARGGEGRRESCLGVSPYPLAHPARARGVSYCPPYPGRVHATDSGD